MHDIETRLRWCGRNLIADGRVGDGELSIEAANTIIALRKDIAELEDGEAALLRFFDKGKAAEGFDPGVSFQHVWEAVCRQRDDLAKRE